MPQLIPDPWFFIFFTTWLSLIMMIQTKTIYFSFLNKLNPKTYKNVSNLWTWPW
uniref:ATP synthase complex subunit 8 n=1 Tax=Theloderma albopunctatum TaxID=1775700 RepID=A0AAU6S695_9NEOB